MLFVLWFLFMICLFLAYCFHNMGSFWGAVVVIGFFLIVFIQTCENKDGRKNIIHPDHTEYKKQQSGKWW